MRTPCEVGGTVSASVWTPNRDRERHHERTPANRDRATTDTTAPAPNTGHEPPVASNNQERAPELPGTSLNGPSARVASSSSIYNDANRLLRQAVRRGLTAIDDDHST